MPGQVISRNGSSGKSTILTLVVHLYDPEGGHIFRDNHAIRTRRIYDLCRAISVHLLPLSIQDDVALGDFAHFWCDVRARTALKWSSLSACLTARSRTWTC